MSSWTGDVVAALVPSADLKKLGGWHSRRYNLGSALDIILGFN